jgi:hypothetical protein
LTHPSTFVTVLNKTLYIWMQNSIFGLVLGCRCFVTVILLQLLPWCVLVHHCWRITLVSLLCHKYVCRRHSKCWQREMIKSELKG